MRFNEALCYSMPPMHIGLQNNNQLQRSSSEIIVNAKDEDSLTHGQNNQEFYIGQDTSTYSSLAVTRNNKLNVHNNNLDNANFQPSSSTESLADYEGYYEEPQDLSGSDWSVYSEDGNLPEGCRGIVNPNYPGFQHLGPSLLSDTDDTEDEPEEDEESGSEDSRDDEFNNNNNNNNNNNVEIVEEEDIVDETVNRLDNQLDEEKQLFYEKPKFNLQMHNSRDTVEEPSFRLEKDRETTTEGYHDNNSSSNYTLVDFLNFMQNQQNAEKDLTDAEAKKVDEIFLTKAPSLWSYLECVNYVKSLRATTNEIFTGNDVEIVQPTTSVKESLQFPEIEQIPDSTKSGEIDEIEEAPVDDPVDLIREAQHNSLNPFLTDINIINNNQTCIKSNSQSNEQQGASEGKLEEMDLLASITRRPEVSGCREQHPQHQALVPDVIAMDIQPRCVTPPAGGLDFQLTDIIQVEKTMDCQINRRGQQSIAAAMATILAPTNPFFEDIKNKAEKEMESGSFDVYNIETAMPKIDMDVIETHLKAAREEERRRRNDREEIRRRLAMGPEADELRNENRRKPRLQSRLQSGMTLQICFMNETSSDSESVVGTDDLELIKSPLSLASEISSNSSSTTSSTVPSITNSPSRNCSQFENVTVNDATAVASRPQALSLPSLRLETNFNDGPLDEADFFARQARLQTEARMALSQAKDMAHMQMEIDRQKLKQNPITEMVRSSLQKIGVTLGEDRRRMTRALLTQLNIAQLQVLANDLHTRIASLNEALVEGLMRRDDLHMEQDSMLVDVEDLTRYLGAKQESFEKRQQQQEQQSLGNKQQQDRQQQQQQSSKGRTLALLSKATSSQRLAAGRQLVVNLVRK